jgi:hypothetical protein
VVNAAPTALVTGIVVTDAEGNFGGGALVVSGLQAEDRVVVLETGGISVSRGGVSFAGVVIGAVSDAVGADFAVTFTAAATTAAVQATARALHRANVSDTPTQSRDLTVTLTDDTVAPAAPVITSIVAATGLDGTGAVILTATATDAKGTAMTYALSGTDAAHFQIDAVSGEIRISDRGAVLAPGVLAPGGSSVLSAVLEVSDGGLTATQTLEITMTPRPAAPQATIPYGGEAIPGPDADAIDLGDAALGLMRTLGTATYLLLEGVDHDMIVLSGVDAVNAALIEFI